MIRKAAAALTGLGLIGGAGSVVYNHNGDATVRIKDGSGHVQTVQIAAAHGRSFSCPAGTHDKVAPIDIRLGRIELTLRQVRRTERSIERRYPSHSAPTTVAVQYNALLRRDDRLVSAFNTEVDAHNALIDRLCTAS